MNVVKCDALRRTKGTPHLSPTRKFELQRVQKAISTIQHEIFFAFISLLVTMTSSFVISLNDDKGRFPLRFLKLMYIFSLNV